MRHSVYFGHNALYGPVFLDPPQRDIGYNFLIGEDGVAYEGRGWDYECNHVDPPLQSLSIGIAFIGTFVNGSIPNHLALNRAKNVIRCGVTKVG